MSSFIRPVPGGSSAWTSANRKVANTEVSQEELEAFAASDPAVQAGLLLYEIRPWLTAMEHP